MWLVAGLGNPGREYERNWHNLGYLVVDYLAQKHRIPTNRIKFKGLFGLGEIDSTRVLLLKPSTFMNQSGESIRSAASFYKIPKERILLLYDDVDIHCGRIRIRRQGSAGTHNGMRSVISHLDTDQFPRIRLGSGPLPDHTDLIRYVLSDIPEELWEPAFESIRISAKAVRCIITEGIGEAMNRHNGVLTNPKERAE
jgi:peptidyl-tRNA hydrolase, PTH1 family